MFKTDKTVNEMIAELALGGIAITRKSVSTTANPVTLRFNQTQLEALSDEICPSPINGYASLVNFVPTSDQPIHRWFRYREGYSTELIKEFIKDLPRGSVVLDPFCGAGTTLLAARERGLPSVGIDVNPISVLVSRVKTTSFTSSLRTQLRKHINMLESVHKKMDADLKPSFNVIDKIFDRDILHALLVFRQAIKSIENTQIREFIFVAWLSILEGVSNVYKEGNGLKYRNRKRTDLGYIPLNMEDWQAAVFPEDRFSFVKERLFKKLSEMVGDLDHMPEKDAGATIIEDTAENIANHILPNSVAMTIFSPPYCNCFNYFKMYKVELWMGEFVSNYQELQQLNRRGLRSHVETVLKKDSDVEEPVSEEYAALLDDLALWDRRIPRAVRGYFIDMKEVLRNIHTVLKPEGKAVIVVGNSAYGGIVIPTDAILAKIAVQLGFKFEKLAVARHLSTSSQQRGALHDRMDYLRESILVLTKEDPRHEEFDLIPVSELPPKRNDVENKVFAIRNSGLTSFTHKFHRYPGKFIPHIPRWALNNLFSTNPKAVVLDPFCGSGTTLVESMLYGINSYGIDIDPIGRLVSKVKTTKISSSHLVSVITDVTAKVSTQNIAKFKPQIPTLSHWFNPAAINDLGIIRDVIEEYKNDADVYDFLLVCFAAIIRRASNADNQTQKTYVSHTKTKVLESAKPLFLNTLVEYSQRLIELSKKKKLGKSTVIDVNDARNFADYWLKAKFPVIDAIITSPPYLNSVDYVYNQMAEYFWIGDLFQMENQSLQNQYKQKYIGSDKVSSEAYKTILKTSIPEIDALIENLFKKNKKNAYVVSQYFIDMQLHFSNAVKVLKNGGSYVCVIGDSLVSGEPIPVHQLIVKCAEKAGLIFDYHFGYEIKNRSMRFPRMGRGSIVRYDWILKFVKS